jgi:hypothetical protein
MGSAQSTSVHRRSSSTDLGYHAVKSSMRMSSSFSDLRSPITGCSASWSRILPNSVRSPCARTGHFYAYSKERHIIAVGCGANSESAPLADFWVLDLASLAWSSITPTGDSISARTGARAVIANDKLYIFGGVADPVFYNDLFVIDMESRNCTKLATTGEIPSPRNTPIVACHGGYLIVWGGYDGRWPSTLHALNLDTLVWTAHEQSVPGKTGTTYAVIGNLLYCYASQEVGGLVVIDLENRVVSQVQTSGVEPPEGVVSSGMVAVEDRLILFGGKTEADFSPVYACDLSQSLWYVFDVYPDGWSVTPMEGRKMQNGAFQMPRIASMGAVYDQRERRVVSFLGRPMESPTPIHTFQMGKAIAVWHLQRDLLDVLALRWGI